MEAHRRRDAKAAPEGAVFAEGTQDSDPSAARRTVRVFDPGPRHWSIYSGLILNSQVRRSLMTDAYLAAIAIEHGLVLCTNDKDFTRFTGLRVFNPLSCAGLPPTPHFNDALTFALYSSAFCKICA